VEEVLLPIDFEQPVRLSGGSPFMFGPSNNLAVWDGETLQVRQRISSYPVRNVINCVPSPDGRLLLMGTAEGGLRLGDLAWGAALPPVCLRTNGSRFKRAAFSDQGNWLAVADTNTLQVWSLKLQVPQVGLVRAAGSFRGLRFSQD
jgi:WD40 repeat protein